MTLLGFVFAGTGLLFIVLALPLIRRQVKPNALYGLRVPATFADEWVWYEANAKSGRDLLLVGSLQIVTAIAAAFAPGINVVSYAIANGVVILVAVLAAAIIGWRRANMLLKERRGAAAR